MILPIFGIYRSSGWTELFTENSPNCGLAPSRRRTEGNEGNDPDADRDFVSLVCFCFKKAFMGGESRRAPICKSQSGGLRQRGRFRRGVRARKVGTLRCRSRI